MSETYMTKIMQCKNSLKFITMLCAFVGVFIAASVAQAEAINKVLLLDSDDGDVVTIEGDSTLNYQVFDLDGPPRLILSFPKASLAKNVEVIKSSGDGVLSVVPVKASDSVRIEVGLSQVMTYDIKEENHALRIHFKAKAQAKSAAVAAVLQDIEVKDNGSVTELVLRGTHMDANHNAFMTQKNKKLILDFWGGESKLAKDDFKYASQRIKEVTVGAADGRVRLIVDLLPSENMHQQIDASASEMRIKLGSVVNKKSVANIKVESVEFQPDDRIAHLMVRTDKTNPVINIREKGKNTIVLDIKKANLLQGQERSQDVSAFPGPIRQVDSYELDGNVRVVARLREKVNVTSFQQGNVFTINFEPEDVAIARSASGEKQSVSAYTGQKVTFDFKNIDLQNALKLIAEMSDLNIIMSDDISGTLTMRLIDVPWDQALDLILSARGLGKETSGNVMRIAPLEVLNKEHVSKLEARKGSRQLEPLLTEFITLNYSKVDDLKKLLEDASSNGSKSKESDSGALGDSKGLLTNRGSFLVDTRTNTLIVKDTQEGINNIKRLVKRIDLPVKQVLIESRIVEAQDNFTRNLGIRWGGNFKSSDNSLAVGAAKVGTGTNTLTGGPGFLVDLPAAAIGTTTTGALGLSFGGISKALNLNLELSAAELDGDVHIVSSPRIVTTNLKQATIKQGVSIAVVTPASANNPATTTYQDAVLELTVTPQITADDAVIMEIKVNKDSPAATGQNINKKEIDTNIYMKSGETVVIGGVYTRSKTNTTNGIPGLSRIPVLGWLFKSNSKKDNKTELLIFITPKILNASGKAV